MKLKHVLIHDFDAYLSYTPVLEKIISAESVVEDACALRISRVNMSDEFTQRHSTGKVRLTQIRLKVRHSVISKFLELIENCRCAHENVDNQASVEYVINLAEDVLFDRIDDFWIQNEHRIK